MSKQYELYLKGHIKALNIGARWLFENVGIKKLNEVLPDLKEAPYGVIFADHDKSKWSEEEYQAYDVYFYGSYGEPNEQVKQNFDYAWLHHIHENSHHWQHWVLMEDDPENVCDMKALEMPDRDIFEMICDWWSFSWRKGDLYEVFNWWNEHSVTVILAPQTRMKVIGLLGLILDKVNELGGEVERVM